MMYKPISIALNAVESVIGEAVADRVILMSPQGKLLTQAMVQDLADSQNIVLISGRYEGVDNRVAEHLVSDEISIGDYVVTGGELPAMVLIDAVSRYVPAVLGSTQSAADDSHSQGLLEYPQYTRPSIIDGYSVPSVLLSGNHAEIEQWRRIQALHRTRQMRPDLLSND